MIYALYVQGDDRCVTSKAYFRGAHVDCEIRSMVVDCRAKNADEYHRALSNGYVTISMGDTDDLGDMLRPVEVLSMPLFEIPPSNASPSQTVLHDPIRIPKDKAVELRLEFTDSPHPDVAVVVRIWTTEKLKEQV